MRSIVGKMESRLFARNRPPATPSSVPNTPINAPCTMNTAMTLRGVAPSVRKIAMSGCFSVTVITSVDTRLNAATATISARMMNIIRFSTCTAANQLRFWRVQSRTSRFGGSDFASCSATSGARCMSAIFTRTPVGPSTRNSRAASPMCSSAIALSYSKWPESKVPTTVHAVPPSLTWSPMARPA